MVENRLSKNNTETVAEHGFRSELWCVAQLPNYEAAADSPRCCVTPRHTACTFSCFAIKPDLSKLCWSAGLTSKGCFNTTGREMWPNGSTLAVSCAWACSACCDAAPAWDPHLRLPRPAVLAEVPSWEAGAAAEVAVIVATLLTSLDASSPLSHSRDPPAC